MLDDFKDFKKKYEDTIDEYGSFESLENIPYMYQIVLGYDMSKSELVFDKNRLMSKFFGGNEDYCGEDELKWIEDNSVDIEAFSPNSTKELMDKITSMGYEDISVFDGKNQDYITACIGIDKLTGRAVYDYLLMIEYLINSDGEFDAESATEWIYYNTIRALPYFKNSPIIIDKEIPV